LELTDLIIQAAGFSLLPFYVNHYLSCRASFVHVLPQEKIPCGVKIIKAVLKKTEKTI
jgi:hypothetical protein